jgi:hypothetical protein
MDSSTARQPPVAPSFAVLITLRVVFSSRRSVRSTLSATREAISLETSMTAAVGEGSILENVRKK